MLFSAPPPPPPPTLGLSFKHKKHHKTSWVSCMTVIRVSSQSNVCKTNTTEDKAVKLFKHQEWDIIWVSQMPIFFFIFFFLKESWCRHGIPKFVLMQFHRVKMMQPCPCRVRTGFQHNNTSVCARQSNRRSTAKSLFLCAEERVD